MKITVLKLSDLHEAKMNIRRHTDKQIAEYVRSLAMFGQIKPIVVDEAGEILAGNGMYQALVRMEAENCECYVVEGLSDKQKKKLMLADNRVYELGITDIDALDDFIKDLEGDIDVPGWDEDLLAMMNSVSSDVDDMVNSYGAFEEKDVAKLGERAAANNNANRKAEAQPQVNSFQSASPSPSSAPAHVTEEQSTAQTQRFIICPKCGERICL